MAHARRGLGTAVRARGRERTFSGLAIAINCEGMKY
jgi:hypothetical protein